MPSTDSDKGRSASKGRKSGASVKRHTYLEMVQVAILTLNERGGSSRQEIWKCIESRFPEADHKRYMIAMRKMSHDGQAIIAGKNRARFTLEANFKRKALKRMEKGMPLAHVLSPKSMTDLVKKKMKKVAKKSGKSGRKSSGKKSKNGRKSGRSAAAKDGKGKPSARDRAKAKAKANKKTEGSAKSKAKVADKRKAAD